MKLSQLLCLADVYNISSLQRHHLIVTSCTRDFVVFLGDVISSIVGIVNHWKLVHVFFMTLSVWWPHECPRARHDARTHARQSVKMFKIDFWHVLCTFQTICNIWKILANARLYARFRRVEHVWELDISFFQQVWIPDSIFSHFYQFTII